MVATLSSHTAVGLQGRRVRAQLSPLALSPGQQYGGPQMHLWDREQDAGARCAVVYPTSLRLERRPPGAQHSAAVNPYL